MKKSGLMAEADAVLRIAANEGFRCGKLCGLEHQVRRAFSATLCNGIGIVPEPMREYVGGVLRTVITLNQIGEDYTVTGASITCFTHGRLTTLKANAEENILCQYDGVGKALKFLWHDPAQFVAKPQDFFGEGFLYKPSRLALSTVFGGTVACVRGVATNSFITNGLCLVSESRVEDIRHYTDLSKLDHDLRALCRAVTSGDEDEVSRILSLLASA